ncbi:WAP four-disulfide core domain protein 18-like [Rattus rattus]|uniref:WAP four-disulfide core domain protein 18-like n=1 Tax=Rattus rattus TaxID=10117 RepID=UPI0013F2CA82|nr:WAP four-disulfide core domain protein 18-like [Rattus rattus]
MKTATVLLLVALITMSMNMAYALFSSKKIVKPGACPMISPIPAGISVNQCSGDESCPKMKKCCPRHNDQGK